jgi:hypothetical protein
MNKNTENTESTEDTERDELVLVELVRNIGTEEERAAVLEFDSIAREATREGRDVIVDAVSWGLGDYRGKGMAAGVTVSERSVLSSDGASLCTVRATIARGDTERTVLVPVPLSLKTGKPDSPNKPVTLCNILGGATGVRRPVMIRPLIVPQRDGAHKFHLNPLLPESKAASEAFDPFA